MTNFQVYRKTLSFSFLMFVVDLFALAILVGCSVAGFFIANTTTDMALIGLVVGLVVGIILAVLINYLITNRIKAAQIAMMVKGVNEGQLPDHTFHAGFEEIKGRFGSLTLFFFVTNAIKGIFRQIGRSINRLGTAIGGDVGNGITSAIDSAIQTLIAYLCDCCLGWVLYRKEENTAKAACEGAVIFFKHGKTLIRNVGRIFGMGFLSLILIGGAIGFGGYMVLSQFPNVSGSLMYEVQQIFIRTGEEVPEWLTNPQIFTIVLAAVGAIVIWSTLHSVLVHPFILVGVLRNFMAAGVKDIPTEADFVDLDKKSPKFAKLHKSF